MTEMKMQIQEALQLNVWFLINTGRDLLLLVPPLLPLENPGGGPLFYLPSPGSPPAASLSAPPGPAEVFSTAGVPRRVLLPSEGPGAASRVWSGSWGRVGEHNQEGEEQQVEGAVEVTVRGQAFIFLKTPVTLVVLRGAPASSVASSSPPHPVKHRDISWGWSITQSEHHPFPDAWWSEGCPAPSGGPWSLLSPHLLLGPPLTLTGPRARQLQP